MACDISNTQDASLLGALSN